MILIVILTYVNSKLHVYQRNMNQCQYKEELQSHLLSQKRQWYSNNDRIFMQDGALNHRTETIEAFWTSRDLAIFDSTETV